jgi:hypothetical protein
MNIRRRYLMWIMTVMLSSAALAAPDVQLDAKHDGKGHGELRKRVGRKMQAYLTAELSSRAALNNDKTAQLQQTVAAFMERRQQARANRREQMNQLRNLVQSKATDAQLNAQLAAVANSAPPDDLGDLMAATSKYLSPHEQALVVMAIPEVLRDARQLMRQGRDD